MDERASIPPGLPRSNPTISYWQSPPRDIADYRSTTCLPEQAEIVIIGSGITGASIAYNILETNSDLNVVVLEARQAASGASGRNGGHTKGASYRTFLDNVRSLGAEEAVKIARLEYDCMTQVHEYITEHGIQCDARRLDTVDVFYDPDQWDQAHESVSLMRKLMVHDDPAAKYTFWNADETASRFLAPGALGAITFEAGSLDAYELVTGILQLALGRGLQLYCNTPAVSLSKVSTEEGATSWIVQTPRGKLMAKKLILATNGYTAHLYPKLQGVIIPIRGFVTAQRPGRAMPGTGLGLTYSFIYKKGFEYLIPRPAGSKFAGDIVIGGGLTQTADDGLQEYGNTDDAALNQDIIDYLENCTERFFSKNWGEDSAEGRIRAAWSGIMGFSGDSYPFIGPVPGEDELFIAAAFQGHGMVNCFLCAKALTQMLFKPGLNNLHHWFPNAYRMTEDRLRVKFRSKLHSPSPTKTEMPTWDPEFEKG